MCIYLPYFLLFTIYVPLSGSYILYTYDSSTVTMIELYTEKKYTQFQFLPTCVKVNLMAKW